MTSLFPLLTLTFLACTDAPVSSESVEKFEQMEQALCDNVDGVPSAMAGLAVATATELGRWEPTSDFEVKRGELRLTAAGKRRCDDGECWNTRAILDLQDAPPGEIALGGESFDAASFRRTLARNFDEQRRCEAGGGRGRDRDSCHAERHELTLESVSPGACDTVYTFQATTPRGTLLKKPEQLANRLIYVGYPENEYLSFTSTATSVSIDPTYWLNPTDDTSSGACSAACIKISRTSVAGACCSCNGAVGEFARSTWSPTTYTCE